MEFNIADYKDRKVVMHCKTLEEAKDFCKLLHNLGRTWHSKRFYLNNTYWDSYKEDTCYYFNDNTYSGMDYYKACEFEILEWSDFMKFNLTDLKMGDICVKRNGGTFMVFPTCYTNLIMLSNFDTLNGHADIEVTGCYNKDLTLPANKDSDIVDVYRPEYFRKDFQLPEFLSECEHVYHRKEPLKVTLKEIAEKFEVDEVEVVMEDGKINEDESENE